MAGRAYAGRGGGGGGWMGIFGGGSAAPPAAGRKQAMMEDEFGGPIDDAERLAVARRYSPDWGFDQTAGAVTDPTRFAGYSARSSVVSSARSFWDTEYANRVGVLTDSISPEKRREMIDSQRRRQFMVSSRRFIEKIKSQPPMSAAERKRAQQRLYSARAQAPARVYA